MERLGPGNSASVNEFCTFPLSPALCSVTRGYPESTGAPLPHPRNNMTGTMSHSCTPPSRVLCLVATPVSPYLADSYAPVKTQLRLYLEPFWLPYNLAREDSSPSPFRGQVMGNMSVSHTGLSTLPLPPSLHQQMGTEHPFCTDNVDPNKGIKSPTILQFV